VPKREVLFQNFKRGTENNSEKFGTVGDSIRASTEYKSKWSPFVPPSAIARLG